MSVEGFACTKFIITNYTNKPFFGSFSLYYWYFWSKNIDKLTFSFYMTYEIKYWWFYDLFQKPYIQRFVYQFLKLQLSQICAWRYQVYDYSLRNDLYPCFSLGMKYFWGLRISYIWYKHLVGEKIFDLFYPSIMLLEWNTEDFHSLNYEP